MVPATMYRVTLEHLCDGVCTSSVTRTSSPTRQATDENHDATSWAILNALVEFWGTDSINVIRKLLEHARVHHQASGVDVEKLASLAEASPDKSHDSLADLAWQAAAEIRDRRKRKPCN